MLPELGLVDDLHVADLSLLVLEDTLQVVRLEKALLLHSTRATGRRAFH